MIASVATAMRARSANMADVPITGPAAPKPVAHGGDFGGVGWRLPTREAEQALLAAAARRYGISDPATIVAAPGTQALIQLLPRLMPRSRGAIVGPTSAEHPLCRR